MLITAAIKIGRDYEHDTVYAFIHEINVYFFFEEIGHTRT